MRLPVCPFSVAVFIGTAWVITNQERRKANQQEAAGDGGDEENQKGSATMTRNTLESTKFTTTTSTNMSLNGAPTFQVVFVLGGPGAGKGTQCQLLEQRLGWKHLSAGDLLRAERQKGGDLGDLINACLAAGALVSSEVTCQLLLNAMMRHYTDNNNSNNNNNSSGSSNTQQTKRSSGSQFLIDGFPRSRGNLDAWNQMTSTSSLTDAKVSSQSEREERHTSNINKVQVEMVLCLECPEEVLTGRLLERGKESGRIDDANLDIIRRRLQTFREETEPIIEYYGDASSSSSMLKRIPSDQPVEQVYQRIAQLIQNIQPL
ncbi:hypothetical protein ACA910_008897 [Epithemia clementina (nom. ined.)]